MLLLLLLNAAESFPESIDEDLIISKRKFDFSKIFCLYIVCQIRVIR
jgi:hypothetical protein